MYDLFTRVARAPRGTGYDGVTIAGVPVEGVRPPGVGLRRDAAVPARRRVCAGQRARAIAAWSTRLAAAAGMTALVPDYSRSPEARYPVALEEMVAVYTGLLVEYGVDPKSIVIVGDSAGGGLTLALAMALRDRGIARPGGARLDLPVGRPRDRHRRAAADGRGIR